MKETEPGRLTARERRFAELIADHTDARSIPQKTLAAGYAAKTHGYALLKRPEITDAIEVLVNQALRIIRASRVQILAALAERAIGFTRINGKRVPVSASDANTAAKTFLQFTGDLPSGGHTTHVNVTQNGARPTLEESMGVIASERAAILGGREMGDGAEGVQNRRRA